MTPTNAIELFSILLGIISILGGGLAWYGASVRKGYAAEREFGHIKNSISQLSENMRVLADELDDGHKTLIELKTLILANNAVINTIAAKVDASTAGWTRPQ